MDIWKRRIFWSGIAGFLILFTSSCTSTLPCPTYRNTGIANDVMKAKARSLEKMENKFFKNYYKHKDRMIIVARKP